MPTTWTNKNNSDTDGWNKRTTNLFSSFGGIGFTIYGCFSNGIIFWKQASSRGSDNWSIRQNQDNAWSRR